jgi:hypothetical protein
MSLECDNSLNILRFYFSLPILIIISIILPTFIFYKVYKSKNKIGSIKFK